MLEKKELPVPLRHGKSTFCAFKPKRARGFSLLQWLPCRCLFSSCSSVYLLGLGESPRCVPAGVPAHLAAHDQPLWDSPVLPWPNHNLPRVRRDSQRSGMTCWERIPVHGGEESCAIAVGHTGNAGRRVGLPGERECSSHAARPGNVQLVQTHKQLCADLLSRGTFCFQAAFLRKRDFSLTTTPTHWCLDTLHFITLHSRCFWKKIGNTSKPRF